MSELKRAGVHLVSGGFPPGSSAGHDMDYARRRLLGVLAEHENVATSISGDFTDVAKWLPQSRFMISYVAGPHLDAETNAVVRDWLQRGGRWLGLHGTSGGRAARVEGRRGRRMVKSEHHETLGAFFLNHPPVRRFTVEVANAEHPLTRGLPSSFEVVDELYLVELQGDNEVLLTTQLEKDPSPPGFGFIYDADTSLQGDGKTRVLGYTKDVGDGAVAYVALGHCHSPLSNSQPFFDDNVGTEGISSATFRGSWETSAFEQLLDNAVNWGVQANVH